MIVTVANFDIVKILTNGGPVDQTHVFATWAFNWAISGNDIPLGASVSLFMAPILALAAILILRIVRQRGMRHDDRYRRCRCWPCPRSAARQHYARPS